MDQVTIWFRPFSCAPSMTMVIRVPQGCADVRKYVNTTLASFVDRDVLDFAEWGFQGEKSPWEQLAEAYAG